jgi:predicted transcriptional regulator
MSVGAPVVADRETLFEAARKMARSGFPAVPAVDSNGRCLGLVTQSDLIRRIVEGSDLHRVLVGDIDTHSYSVDPDETLDIAIERMGAAGISLLPVIEDGQLVGEVTSVDVEAQRLCLATLGSAATDLIDEVSSLDPMYTGSRGSYLMSGVSALQCIRSALQVANSSATTTILDLPSGFGRVLRVLKAAFPNASLTACDLDRDAVDFCSKVLDANGVYSNSDPAAISLSGPFDLIWCGSLFTHLDEPRWRGFLEVFDRLLAPEGVVLFTTHGRHPASVLRSLGVQEAGVSQMLSDYDKAGFGYSLMPIPLEQDYGLAIAAPEWVKDQIKQHTSLTMVDHRVRAWRPPAPLQDVVVCKHR